MSAIRTFNVEAGMPTLDEARRLVIEEIEQAKRAGAHVLKAIHGQPDSYSSPTERPAADAKEVGMGNPAEETTATELKKSSIALATCQQASSRVNTVE